MSRYRSGSMCPREKGFSLVEMMVALFILSFSILGFSALVLTSIQTNSRNDLRNTAVRLTKQTAENFLARSMAEVPEGPVLPTTIPVKIKGTDVSFTVTSNVTDLSANLKQIEIEVSYTHRGSTFTNSSIVFKHKAI